MHLINVWLSEIVTTAENNSNFTKECENYEKINPPATDAIFAYMRNAYEWQIHIHTHKKQRSHDIFILNMRIV